MNESTLGLVILLIAGVMNAGFTLPMKFTRKWAWENTWFAFTIFALLVLPPIVTWATVPQLGEVYGQAGTAVAARVFAFGAGWGVAQVFFGLAVDAIGIALTFSIILGLSAALGSLIPLIQLHSDKVFTGGGMGVIAGVVLVVIGVTVLAVAGRRREAATATAPQPGKASFGKGLTFALSAGVLAACMNFAIAFGSTVREAAVSAGADPLWAPMAIWLLVMLGGAIPNLVYTLHLLRKNHTGSRFSQSGTAGHWFLAGAMAFLWFASTLLYGVASVKLGDLGAVLGWPLFMSLIVITASVLGYATGEWKGAGKQPVRIMSAGVVVLVVAVFVLANASRYL